MPGPRNSHLGQAPRPDCNPLRGATPAQTQTPWARLGPSRCLCLGRACPNLRVALCLDNWLIGSGASPLCGGGSFPADALVWEGLQCGPCGMEKELLLLRVGWEKSLEAFTD